jgi:hypothetical protein
MTGGSNEHRAVTMLSHQGVRSKLRAVLKKVTPFSITIHADWEWALADCRLRLSHRVAEVPTKLPICPSNSTKPALLFDSLC